MALLKRDKRARSGPEPSGSVGEIRASVRVAGDVSGQLAVGSHIAQMRVDTVLGNLVTVLPPEAKANITPRPVPISLVPRRPALMVDRQHETALAVEALSTRRPVELLAPPGMGKSTLLRSLAHQLPISEACGGMAHLSARGLSHDDLLQVLFDVFYSADIPVKPTPGELRHLLQHVHAALLLDDVEVSDDDVSDVEDYAPECGFILTTASNPGDSEALAIELTGLRGADARALVAHALGRPLGPEEQPAVDAMCDLVEGAPAGLLRLAAAARNHDGTLAEFAATAAASGAPPLPVESAEDVRLLGLLAAIPGVHLDVRQLSEITGLADVHERIDQLVARGLVLGSAPAVSTGAPIDYSLAAGVDLGPSGVWQMSQRRAELREYFLKLSEERSETLLAPGAPAESLRALHSDAAKHREWRYVLGLGVLLDAAYALSGRWDAWREVSRNMLSAAQALGDRGAEAMALHQLGTRALCDGETAVATRMLHTALELRTAIGAVAAAQVTQHNLALIIAPPPLPPEDHSGSTVHQDQSAGYQDDGGATAAHSSGVDPGSSGAHAGVGQSAISGPALTTGASLVVVSALVAGIVILRSGGSDAADVTLDQSALSFSAVALNQTSESQTVTARNLGGTPVHVDGFPTSGPNRSEFVVTGTTCRNSELAAGETCKAEVIFTPTGAGPREGSVTVDVRELSADPVVGLSGSSPGPDQASSTALPTELSFGEQPLNTAGERRQVSIAGPSGAPVVLGTASVSGLDAAEFAVDGNDCSGAQLVPGAGCTVGVRFTPGAKGSRQGLLTVPGPDGVSGVAVPLSGSGAAPARDASFQLEPRSVAFGEQVVSVPSAPKQVVLRNSGEIPLDVSHVSVAGAPDFTVGQAACPASLEPGQDCAVTVLFTPVTTGGRAAQLIFGGGGGPAVPLSGAGAAPEPVAPDISPRALTFDQQLVGGVSPAQKVTVTNRADRPLRVTPGPVMAATAAFRSDTAACTAADIAPGASCAVSVNFVPTGAGAHSGILLLSARGFPDAAVVLRGVGLDSRTPLVPGVIGMPLAGAQNELTAAGFVTGTIREIAHLDIPRGSVSDQVPRGGVPLAAGGAVDLFVSTGPKPVTVPDVVNLTQSEAAKRLLDVGLRVGAVSQRSDPSIEAGVVLETGPPAGTQVAAGSPVDLVLAAAPPCTVPELTGRTQAEATAALETARLRVGSVSERSDSTVKGGLVLGTSPSTGAELACGSAVDLVLASTPPKVGVPDVVGMYQDEAATELGKVGLKVGTITQRPDHNGPGEIVESNPPARQLVDAGSSVNLVLSSGPLLDKVPVPHVVGLPESDAIGRVQGDDLQTSVTRQSHPSVPTGQVISTNPAAGTPVDRGSAVALVVSTGPPQPQQVTVPDLKGLTVQQATARLEALGLKFGGVTEEAHASVAQDTVIRSDPAANAQVDPGRAVALVVSTGPPPPQQVGVPKVVGLCREFAISKLRQQGFTVTWTYASYGKDAPWETVRSIDPPENTLVNPGSAVTLVVAQENDLSPSQGCRTPQQELPN